jgi:4-oxalocrotonate tautomerase
MPTIHVELFEGRTIEQKAALARALTDACVQVLGGSAASVDVIYRDVARHDWATGGRLWSEPAAAAPPSGPAGS